jgi:hypothetical protein
MRFLGKSPLEPHLQSFLLLVIFQILVFMLGAGLDP